MTTGWIKLHRKLRHSPMYKALNCKQRDVFIQCLLLADHSPNEWEWGARIFKTEPGQFVTSLDSIAESCSREVSVQSVRTALLKLEKWCFLTNKSTKTGRLITIINWDSYQIEESDTNKGANRQPTKSQQSSNKELTANKNVKNVKNGKKDKNKDSSVSAYQSEHGTAVWESYLGAYAARYGTDPIRNAKSNAACKQLVQRIGAEIAPHVAAFYISSNAQWYINKGHSLQALVGDAEKLATEWQTGNRATNTTAREADRMQSQGESWQKMIDKYGD